MQPQVSVVSLWFPRSVLKITPRLMTHGENRGQHDSEGIQRNFNVYQNHAGSILKHRFLGSTF